MLHQGVRVGDIVVAIVSVVEEGEDVGKGRGICSTSQTTDIAAMVRRANGSTSEVIIRGLWRLPLSVLQLWLRLGVGSSRR